MTSHDPQTVVELATIIAANDDQPPRVAAEAVLEWMAHRAPRIELPIPQAQAEGFAQDIARRIERALMTQRAVFSPDDIEQRYQDLLGHIYLHVSWRLLTRQLGTDERELWADAYEAWSERLHPGDGSKAERWWR